MGKYSSIPNYSPLPLLPIITICGFAREAAIQVVIPEGSKGGIGLGPDASCILELYVDFFLGSLSRASFILCLYVRTWPRAVQLHRHLRNPLLLVSKGMNAQGNP